MPLLNSTIWIFVSQNVMYFKSNNEAIPGVDPMTSLILGQSSTIGTTDTSTMGH